MTLHKKYELALNILYGGNIGTVLYGFARKFCKVSFDNKISPEIPIILTTAMSPYNRFDGWYSPLSNTIEIVRQHCNETSEGITVKSTPQILALLAHEICHIYQSQILGGKIGARGPHRCKSWYDSITLASPYICGVNIEGLCKPLKSVREGASVYKVKNPASLTEVELTHFPESIIKLAKEEDHRIKRRIIGKPAIEV